MFVIFLKVFLGRSGVITCTMHLLGPAWDTSEFFGSYIDLEFPQQVNHVKIDHGVLLVGV